VPDNFNAVALGGMTVAQLPEIAAPEVAAPAAAEEAAPAIEVPVIDFSKVHVIDNSVPDNFNAVALGGMVVAQLPEVAAPAAAEEAAPAIEVPVIDFSKIQVIDNSVPDTATAVALVGVAVSLPEISDVLHTNNAAAPSIEHLSATVFAATPCMPMVMDHYTFMMW
jgi:hypothetical protein